MRKLLLAVITILIAVVVVIYIVHRSASLDDRIKNTLESHYNRYHQDEYFSGISLAVYIPNQEIKTFFTGTQGHEANSEKINAATLFQIGSITKSFTSAIILQLEKENKLTLADKLGKWLPEYEKWSDRSIESLLNMTSGLPNYTDAPLLNAAMYQNPARAWSDRELIQLVYPTGKFNPPLRGGYHYTNTGYALAGMIIEKITSHSFQDEVTSRLINTAELHDTFYPVPKRDAAIMKRLAHGYGYNPYINPELVGRDISSGDLSWAGAAGAMISTPSDVIRWVRALFTTDTILDADQKIKLMRMVSTTTGKAITSANLGTQGFALGVIQAYNKDIGKYWFYEGETEGFRALYMYVPENGIIISAIFNSTVDSENDHAGQLMTAVYQLIKGGAEKTS